jgi:signal recognition particle subunit SRP9
MTYYTAWDEFVRACERLHAVNPGKCRFVTKYSRSERKLILKLTDDVVCLQVCQRASARKRV